MSTTFFKLTMYSGAGFALADHSKIHLPIRSWERPEIKQLAVGNCQNDCFDQHHIDGDGHCFFHAVGAGADDQTRRILGIANVKAGAELRRKYVEYVRNNAFNPNASADLKYAIGQAVSDRVHGVFRNTITDADLTQWERIMSGSGPRAYGDNVDAAIIANMLGVTITIRHQFESVMPLTVATPIDVPSRFNIYLWKTSNHFELLSLKSERDMVHVGGNNTQQAPVDDELARAIAMSLREQEQSVDDEMQAAVAASLASEKADEEKRVAEQQKEEDAKRVADKKKVEEAQQAEKSKEEEKIGRISKPVEAEVDNHPWHCRWFGWWCPKPEDTKNDEALALQFQAEEAAELKKEQEAAQKAAEEAKATAQKKADEEAEKKAKEAAEKKKRQALSEAAVAKFRREDELARRQIEADKKKREEENLKRLQQAQREQEAALRKAREEADAAYAAQLQAEEVRRHQVLPQVTRPAARATPPVRRSPYGGRYGNFGQRLNNRIAVGVAA